MCHVHVRTRLNAVKEFHCPFSFPLPTTTHYRSSSTMTFMLSQPSPEFVVEGGTLLYDPNRDSRFQYFFSIPTHPLVTFHDENTTGRIIVYIQDTDKDIMAIQFAFEKTLQVPLGTNASITTLGVFPSLYSSIWGIIINGL